MDQQINYLVLDRPEILVNAEGHLPAKLYKYRKPKDGQILSHFSCTNVPYSHVSLVTKYTTQVLTLSNVQVLFDISTKPQKYAHKIIK
jgi:hypothetical protein